jgi:TatD DNase family protein|tara:strand:- start:3456 stop:4208 length:753 start_codon:yes stop_codon:yes gene_type:complete
MEIIDVHSHVNSEQFDKDRITVVQHSLDNGLVAILDSGENLKENEKAIELALKFPVLKPCAGFSPKNLKKTDAKLMQDYIRANAEKFIAIGEVGLDYWCVKEEADRKKQREIFESFIELAKELDKPIVVHSRSAGKYAIDLLKKHGATRVCMHAFDGSAQNAMIGTEAGFFFSIPPSIVRSEQKQKMVMKLPIENLLLESDAPSLGPDKGKRNEPKNILTALKEVARIKELTKAEVAEQANENARKLFKL